jgi:lipoprotein-anchoring transpeptidase ErfK/SrfK
MLAKVSLFRSAVAGAAVLASAASFTATAQAQDLIDFLWGGGEEWGGGRQTVTFDPQYRAGQIIVSFGDRRLYLIEKAGTAVSYPIAAPREQSRWQGKTTVTMKKENPSWTPTPEMFKENPKLPSWVPGGHPMNPLGVRAMYLGSSTYRIHGTDAPWTIGQAVSKGCIRMYNEDVLDLYPRVPVGMRVTVTWERFKTGPASTEISRLEGTNHKASAMPKNYGSSANSEPTPVAETAAVDKEPAVVEGPAVEAKDEPAIKTPAPKAAAVQENYDDEGYIVDNTGGSKRVTKIGRKPLVTRTSASAE